MKFLKLKDAVKIYKGKKPNILDEKTENSVRVLQIDDLRNDNLLKYTDDKTGVLANENDVLIVWDGANAGTIGYGKSGYIGSTIALLRKNDDSLDTVYLGKFLQTKFHFLRQKTNGATIPHVDRVALESLKIPLPPLEDQIRIAHILSQAEELIAKRRASIKLLDEYIKSTFLEMFGDPHDNPKNFPITFLKNLYIDNKNGTKCGPFGSALKKEEFVDNGIPVWNMDNISINGQMVSPFRMWITDRKFKELQAYSVLDGDVIISRAGTVGKMCVAKMNGVSSIISTNLIRVRFGNKLLPIFFISLMNYCKNSIGRLKTGADGTFTHMSTGVLDNLEFPCPPLPLQTQFAEIVDKVEALKAKYQKSVEELENLYGSLSQRAFNLKKL